MIPAPTVDSIYKVPQNFEKHQISKIIAEKLELGEINPDLGHWQDLTQRINKSTEDVKIALVGKYTHLEDSYISVIEALKAAGYAFERKLNLSWK